MLLALDEIVAEQGNVEEDDITESVYSNRFESAGVTPTESPKRSSLPNSINSSPDAAKKWLNRDPVLSKASTPVPSVFQVLRSVRFEISKYLNELSVEGGAKRYTRGAMRGLADMLKELMFGGGRDAFEYAGMKEIEECLGDFVNRSVKSCQVKLFEALDEVVAEVVTEQHRSYERGERKREMSFAEDSGESSDEDEIYSGRASYIGAVY
jgi:hypothetical protein